MIVCIYDTETSKDMLWKDPTEHPDQPHIVQYTSVLFDDTSGEELGFHNQYVKPDGWAVDDEFALKYHGITNAKALAEGEPEHLAVANFLEMVDVADRISAFNVEFDIRVMRIACLRDGMQKPIADLWAERIKAKKHCVMRACTPVCKLPPTEKMMASNRKTFKSPKLEEAIKALFGETMADAHDARGDVLATKKIYLHLKGLGLA